MSLPKEQQEMAEKFMSAVFAAGIENCQCQAATQLRELAKQFMSSKTVAPKIQKPKKV